MQAIYNIAEICAVKGIQNAIISPGSRSAPLTISFARHPAIEVKVISDERAAAFIAMGIARQSKKIVALICTSGTAGLNYGPAVAESFYQQIPLLILTADRPPEWIDQLDGQTIRQTHLFGQHVKASYSLPADPAHPNSKWTIERTLSEAINRAEAFPPGPVHINIPLREPFYPEKEIAFEKDIKIISEQKSTLCLSASSSEALKKEISGYSKILIVPGQNEYNPTLQTHLKNFAKTTGAAIVSDVISNTSEIATSVHHDLILQDATNKKNLQPDLLISFGKSIISKELKTFLRNYRAKAHWHIQEYGEVADTFQSLTKIVRLKPEDFFKKLFVKKTKNGYTEKWQVAENHAKKHVESFFQKESTFSEFRAIYMVLESLPENSLLHLSNSMPVRYVNYLSTGNKKVEVFANRGTSGIDGVLSTAVGAALATNKIVTLLIGDMAFFYDRNAFWHNFLPSNLRIVLLNNHGGGIFRTIEGSSQQPELETYFETEQPLIAVGLAFEYNLDYFFCKEESAMRTYLEGFYEKATCSKILEIETNSKVNTDIFNNFKNHITHGK